MMCEYCNGKVKPLIETECVAAINYWDDNCLLKDAIMYKKHVVLEQRNGNMYIRLVYLDDCNCMDHGDKFKINYCPMCGRKLNDEENATQP